jgi:hypothetical protein
MHFLFSSRVIGVYVDKLNVGAFSPFGLKTRLVPVPGKQLSLLTVEKASPKGFICASVSSLRQYSYLNQIEVMYASIHLQQQQLSSK